MTNHRHCESWGVRGFGQCGDPAVHERRLIRFYEGYRLDPVIGNAAQPINYHADSKHELHDWMREA